MAKEAEILHALLNGLRSAVAIFDSDGKLLYESRAMREMQNRDPGLHETQLHGDRGGSGLELILPSGSHLWMTELAPPPPWAPQRLLDALPDAVWWRQRGEPTKFSRGFRELYGYPFDGNLPPADERMALVHKDDRKRVQQMLNDAIAQFRRGRSYVGECYFRSRRADQVDQWLHIHTRVTTMPADGPHPQVILGWHRDVTKLKRLLHEKILDRVPGIVFVKDEEGRLRWVNARMCKIFGRERADIINKTDFGLGLPRNECEEFAIRDRLAFQLGKSDVEQEKLTPPGHPTHIFQTKKQRFASDSFNAEGKVERLLFGVGIETTLASRCWQALMESLPEPIFFKNSKEEFLWVNSAMVQMVGAESADELKGQTTEKFFPPDVVDLARAEDQAVLRGKKIERVVRAIRTKKNMQPRLVEVSKVLIAGTPEHGDMILGLGRDVTDSRILKYLVTDSEQCSVLVNTQLQIHWCNRAYAEHYGRNGDPEQIERLIGQPASVLWKGLEDEGADYRRTYEEMLRNPGDQAITFKKEQRWKDGKRRWLVGERRIIGDWRGDPVYILVHFDDRTEWREANVREGRAEAQEEVLRFLGHALQGKGTSVQNWLGSLIDTLGPRPQLVDARRVVDEMILAARKATKLAAAGGKVSESTVRLQTIVRRLAYQHRHAPIPVHISEIDPAVCIFGNEFYLETAIDELILNAIRHAAETREKEGAVTVTFEVSSREVMILIHDNGPGVPVALRGAIFERIVAGNPSRTGIGLMMVRTIVEDVHKGQVVLLPTIEGATFRITLPLDSPHLNL